MPRYKVLRGVANVLGQSFVSLANYGDGDYVMGHLLARMLVTGDDAFRIDLLAGTAEPRPVLTRPVRQAAEHYAAWFRDLVRSHGSDLRYVRSAGLEVRYDLARVGWHRSGAPNGTYRCASWIVDDRGREYRWASTGSWYPEVWAPPSAWTTGFHRTLRWLRRAVRRSPR